MRIRAAFPILAAPALVLAIVPLGCQAGEEYIVVEHPRSAESTSVEATLPEFVIDHLRTCVRAYGAELRTYSHEVKFNVTLTEAGAIERITLRSSTVHHAQLESCMMQELATVSIPSSVIPMRASEPISGGERMRHSRGPLGVVQAAGGLVVLGPIILVAAGVTLGVYIVAVAAEQTIEAVRRTKKLEQMCTALLVECISGNKRLPPDSDFGTHKQCEFCFGFCVNEGYWPLDKCPRSN